jgi:hypothetical protein
MLHIFMVKGVVQKPEDQGNTFELSKSLKSPGEKGSKFSVFSKVLPEFEPRRIKLIKRQAYGFTNFEHLRTRLLACLSH